MERDRSNSIDYSSYTIDELFDVIDHGNQNAIRKDANHLANFLKIPVWEFQEERERNFFIKFLGLKF